MVHVRLGLDQLSRNLFVDLTTETAIKIVCRRRPHLVKGEGGNEKLVHVVQVYSVDLRRAFHIASDHEDEPIQ